jgi:hypothetical protein
MHCIENRNIVISLSKLVPKIKNKNKAKKNHQKYRHFFWVTCFKNNQQKKPPEI